MKPKDPLESISSIVSYKVVRELDHQGNHLTHFKVIAK